MTKKTTIWLVTGGILAAGAVWLWWLNQQAQAVPAAAATIPVAAPSTPAPAATTTPVVTTTPAAMTLIPVAMTTTTPATLTEDILDYGITRG